MTTRGFIDGEYQDGEVRGRIFVTGTSGFGKTTELVRMLEQCSGTSVLYDHTGRHTLKGAIYVHSISTFRDALIRVLDRRARIVYQPEDGDLMEHLRGFSKIVALIGGLIVGFDEIDEYCGPEWGRKNMPPELYTLCHHGRHKGAKACGRRGVSMLYTARVPKSIAPGLRSQASEIRFFHEHEPEIVKYWAGIVGSELAGKLVALQKYQYLIWKNNGQPPVFAGGQRKL